LHIKKIMKKLLLATLFSFAVSLGFAQTNDIQAKKDTLQLKNERSIIRARFDQIFKENENGSFTPIYTTNVNGTIMTPGVSFSPGVSFGGLDLSTLKGHDLAIDTVKGVVIIKGHY